MPPEDFFIFYYIFDMDAGNVAQLKTIAAVQSTAQILLLGSFGLYPNHKIIHDPYYARKI